MMIPARSRLTLCLCLGLASLGASLSSHAQDANGSLETSSRDTPASARTDASNTLPTVTVTASKQGRTTFNAAAGVSVVEGTSLEARHLDTLGDIAERLPNVYQTSFTRANPSITIRGLGFSDDESDSMSTSVLIDGVPMYGLVLGQLFDLEQIEVLRGPQSTLYGQNSMGGLIALRSRDPGSDPAGSAQMEYGSGRRRRLTLDGDLPLSASTSVRLVVGGEDADGYVNNTVLHRDDTTGWSNRFARIKLLHRDANDGEWRIGLHHVRMRGGNDFFATPELARKHESDAGDPGKDNAQYTLLSGEYNREFGAGTKLAVTLGGNRTNWNYWLPRSIFGARTGFDMSTRQFSAEARLSGQGDRVDWLLGVFGSHVKREAPYLFDSHPYYLSDTRAVINGGTAAAFGELGWHFAPGWRLAGALRLEHDRRRMDWSGRQAGLFDGNGDGMPETPFDGTERLQGVHTRDNVALPRIALEYQPDVYHFGWLTLARGYKASGFNTYATTPAAAGEAYRPEYGNHAELGYRLRGADGSWELSANVFNTRLRDQQVVIIDSNSQSMTTNAGRSHSRGAELSAMWRPLRGLELGAFAGYVNAEYDRYVKGSVDYAGKQFANTPRHSYGMSASWQPAAAWDLGLSLTRQGSANLYPNSSVVNGGYNLLDAHVTWQLRRWTVGLYGKNLTNAHYYTRALSDRYVVAGNPRTVGMRLGMDF